MELLKRSLKLVAIAAIFMSIQVNAQNYKAMQDSFASSYKYEKNYFYY